MFDVLYEHLSSASKNSTIYRVFAIDLSEILLKLWKIANFLQPLQEFVVRKSIILLIFIAEELYIINQ